MDLLKRENFASGAPFEDKAGYSRAVKVGNMVFVGGTTTTNSQGEVEAPGDAYLQTKIILEKTRRGHGRYIPNRSFNWRRPFGRTNHWLHSRRSRKRA